MMGFMKRVGSSNKFTSSKPRNGVPILAYAFGAVTIGIIGFMGFLMFGHFPAPQKLVTEEIAHDRFKF